MESSEPLDPLISKNLEKKIQRKLHKHQHTVTKETGVSCSEYPTKNLAICNAGQINGLTEAKIMEEFNKFGPIEQVLLVPGKSCSFLSYRDVESASEAWKTCNGKLNIAQDSKPIFLSYTNDLPAIKDDRIYDRLPPGLVVIHDFITESQESTLLSTYKFDDTTNTMKHRQVKHFGYEFRYDINNVDKDQPLEDKVPSEFSNFWSPLETNQGIHFEPDQLTINHYQPGQGIPSHIDTHSAFEDPIVSLSLGSQVVMEFKKGRDQICVLLPRRSLAVMTGESRYDWTHGIMPKTFDFYYDKDSGCVCFKRGIRVSFTFRKVLQGECQCNYKSNCDSFKAVTKKLIEDDTIASNLETLHVHDVYEDIAGHFSETRHKPWPNVLDFINSFKCGDVVVDVGCGNGKYFGHNSEIFEIGTDRSFRLNDVCRGRGFESFTGNCLNVPLRDNVADGLLCIAVIHHLSTEERRIQSIKEFARVLKPGGKALIYVWAKQQVKNAEKSTYIKQDRKNRKSQKVITAPLQQEEQVTIAGVSLPVHTNRTDFNHSDLLVPWKLKKIGKDKDHEDQEKTFLRYYHVFEDGELDRLCVKVGVEIIKSYYDQGNWCVIFKKS